MLSKFLRREKGITGLETAIILIAFVVVASVFAYTALSAGLFSTQKGQEAVYAGLREAQSTLELKGSVVAIANQAGGEVKQITFTVSNVLNGEAIDFTEPAANLTSGRALGGVGSTHKVVINYIDKDQAVNDLFWAVTKLGNADEDYLLETNEKFKITVGGPTANVTPGNLIDALGTALGENTRFSLVVQTPVGAVLEIQRTTPAYIDEIMNLR